MLVTFTNLFLHPVKCNILYYYYFFSGGGHGWGSGKDETIFC